MDVAVGLGVGEIVLVVDEIIGDPVELAGHDANVNITQIAEIHVKMMDILEFIAVFFGDAGIIRQHNAHIIFTLVECLWKRACNVGQPARFNKRDAFRCDK